MNLLLRVLYVFISAFFKPKIADICAPSYLKLVVCPNDLDFNMHMNNGRYLTIMD
ncbi:MAG TPA: Mesenchymal stem cell protein DSCD75, partial [Rhodospirillaceae bacterium]|nr:Mesenchymal stem cell protein DSCD75 [Rhodospirillaceae bacterium]